MEPVELWDEDYINNVVVPSDETDQLEKKALEKFSMNAKLQPDGECKDELAKQVSAFANSGAGFIVYGITDAKALDAGVPMSIGTQTTKDWIEAAIPTLVYPSIIGCQVRSIQITGQHGADKSLLIVSVPLSERRPHWATTGPREIAYIRAGAHSLPMRPQSLLDIASRSGASSAEIVHVRKAEIITPTGAQARYRIMPYVRLLNGRACERWSLQIESAKQDQLFTVKASGGVNGIKVSTNKFLYLLGTEPLFPGRITAALPEPLEITVDTSGRNSAEAVIRTTLYLDSGSSVVRDDTIKY